MSIEQKIAEMLAQSKLNEGVTLAGKEGGMDPGTHGAQAGDKAGESHVFARWISRCSADKHHPDKQQS